MLEWYDIQLERGEEYRRLKLDEFPEVEELLQQHALYLLRVIKSYDDDGSLREELLDNVRYYLDHAICHEVAINNAILSIGKSVSIDIHMTELGKEREYREYPHVERHRTSRVNLVWMAIFDVLADDELWASVEPFDEEDLELIEEDGDDYDEDGRYWFLSRSFEVRCPHCNKLLMIITRRVSRVEFNIDQVGICRHLLGYIRVDEIGDTVGNIAYGDFPDELDENLVEAILMKCFPETPLIHLEEYDEYDFTRGVGLPEDLPEIYPLRVAFTKNPVKLGKFVRGFFRRLAEENNRLGYISQRTLKHPCYEYFRDYLPERVRYDPSYYREINEFWDS